MNTIKRFMASGFGKAALASLALAGFFALGGAPSAQARDWDGYRPGVARYDNYRAHVAAERHGFYSPRADYWRHERFEHGWRDRYGCWHRY